MRTAIYVRVACATQTQPRSIEQQLDRLHTHLVAAGEKPAAENIFRDGGRGGLTLDRPSLNCLRDQVRLGEYERVLVTSPDRLSRSYALLRVLVKEFERAGCRIEIIEYPHADGCKYVLSLAALLAAPRRCRVTSRMTQRFDRGA